MSNLAKEAGVSRAVANRADGQYWSIFITASLPLGTRRRSQVYVIKTGELECRLAQVTRKKKQIIADLQATVALLVQQIQALTLENEQLPTSAAKQGSLVTVLP